MAKHAAGVFRRGDETTFVGVTVDAKSFRQNGRTADVRMELGGKELEVLTSHDKLKLDRSLQVYQMQVYQMSSEEKGCHLFLKMDHVRDD